MPPTSAKGPLLEARVARLLHAEGGFVRCRVDLNARFREHFQVTDIDVLAFSFDKTLETRITNGECKTATAKSAPSTADRLLWLAGVAKLIDADGSFLATAKSATDNTRALAVRLEAEILDPLDLQRREHLAGLSNSSGYGPHAPELADVAANVAKTIKGDDDLTRIHAFVRSDLWLAQPTAALKRALQACRVLGGRYSDALPEAERTAVRWLAAESVIGITLALARIAGRAYRQPEDVFERYLHERLAEGAASYAAMRDMSKTIDKYLVGVLRELGVDPVRAARTIGAFEPTPPPYTEPLVELIQRLALAAPATGDLARLSEHYLLSELHPAVRSSRVPASDEAETARLLRLVAAFLERQANMPRELLDPLRSNGRGQAVAIESKEARESGAPSSTEASSMSDGPQSAAENAQRPQLFQESGT